MFGTVLVLSNKRGTMPHIRRTIAQAVIVLMIAAAFILAAPPHPADAQTQVVYTDDIVFRGGAGETLVITWANPEWAVGQPCTVTAVVSNGPSEHEGNVLDVGPLRAVEIESTANGVTTVSGVMVVPATGTATVTLSDDPAHAWRPPTNRRPGVWVFSGRLEVSIECLDDTTTTSSAPSTSTTTPTSSTSSTPSETTTTTDTPATTTTAPTGSTTTTSPDETTTTAPGSSTSTTVPPASTPDPTLPLTGPAEAVGVAMAAAAQVLLGVGLLVAAREGDA